ncbi:MAG TPA: DUF3226 domain-containing protein [Bacteroidia bacterium]|nr:DUF3226 domain-containing protein [Bacteroidia bacterium]
MAPVKIFVEGDSDKKFIGDYIKFLKIENDSIDIETLSGKDIAHFKNVSPSFIKKEEEGKNLVIIDTDSKTIADKTNELSKIKLDLDLNFEAFFLPDNKSTGELESLLCSIIPEKQKLYFDCIDKFSKCVKDLKQEMKPPSLKDSIHLYCCSLLTQKESKSRDKVIGLITRNYADTRFWDLNHLALLPLKQFLTNHLVR